MLCGWEGDHRSGVTLAVRHKLSDISTHGLSGLNEAGDRRPLSRRRSPNSPLEICPPKIRRKNYGTPD